MSLRPVFNVVGVLLVFLAGAMLLTAGVSLYYDDGAVLAFLGSCGITLPAGYLTYRRTRFQGDISHRQGYATVTFAWTFVALFGALPFMLSGVLDSPVQAFFESMSGFTTTGATVFSDIESLPEGILLWRSLTHWLGGMGIIVLAIAVLPFLGVGGMQLFKAEAPGPTLERLRPRMTQTAKLLWFVYVGLTAVQVLLYVLGGLTLFDAVNHAFATLATGGFSTRNDSIASFSRYNQYVTLLFMYLAGVNFALHFRAASGRPAYWTSEGWRFFTMLIVGAGVGLAAINLISGEYALSGPGLERALREGLFQSTSIVTTTGFVSADYEVWRPAAQGLLLTLMFTGGMAGSTAGGVKIMRVVLTLKYVATQMRKHLHPRAVLLTRLGNRPVKEDVLATVVGFVFLYIVICLLGTMAMSFAGMDLLTAFGASAATVGNIGPGVGDVGATENFGWIPDPALAVLTFLMLVGRLELYTVLLLFHPDMWRRRRTGVRQPRVRSDVERALTVPLPDGPSLGRRHRSSERITIETAGDSEAEPASEDQTADLDTEEDDAQPAGEEPPAEDADEEPAAEEDDAGPPARDREDQEDWREEPGEASRD